MCACLRRKDQCALLPLEALSWMTALLLLRVHACRLLLSDHCVRPCNASSCRLPVGLSPRRRRFCFVHSSQHALLLGVPLEWCRSAGGKPTGATVKP